MTAMAKKRVAVLISGRGSNMASLIAAAKDDSYPAEIALVLSNRPDAPGLANAKRQGITTAVVDHTHYGKDREAFERAVDAELRNAGVELIALAGFMRVLTPWFVNSWAGRLINIHPSLLPLYPGVDTHARCLEAGDVVHGCTVHQVTAGVDEGPVIGSAEVDVVPGDTPETLAARVLKAEHLLYPRCLAAVARKAGTRVREDITIEGVTVRLYAPRG
jgi:phosphoribosylglycinamide formyltransferase-1